MEDWTSCTLPPFTPSPPPPCWHNSGHKLFLCSCAICTQLDRQHNGNNWIEWCRGIRHMNYAARFRVTREMQFGRQSFCWPTQHSSITAHSIRRPPQHLSFSTCLCLSFSPPACIPPSACPLGLFTVLVFSVHSAAQTTVTVFLSYSLIDWRYWVCLAL